MPDITVITQAEWDALPVSFEEPTIIIIQARRGISIGRIPYNASAVLRDNASAVLRDNASAVLRDNASAEAWGTAMVRLHGDGATAVLLWLSVCLLLAGKAIKKSPVAKIVDLRQRINSEQDWLEWSGIDVNHGHAVIYKRVSKDFLTQEGSPNETRWLPGESVQHPQWAPQVEECGAGKFHGCARPFLADEFRSQEGDRYVAIRVRVQDLFAWKHDPQYPHKIAFGAGAVLYECDRHGKQIEAAIDEGQMNLAGK